jgi:serine/threonine protein kinase
MPLTSQSQRLSAGRAARVAVKPQSRLGSWELVRLIGEGQLASVYQARPTGSPADRPGAYALKVLRPEWQDDSRGLAALARETLVGRQVANAHLVPVLAAQLVDPPYYLAMPLLEGHSLAQQLRAHGQLALPVAFWIARQVAEALEALHQGGWMHGDVKPSNILVAPCGHATLIDLGFARQTSELGSVADRPVLGTIQYIAPEMLYSSLGGDTHSDVYSLGVTMFEMLTGRLPFDAQDIAELAAQHRQGLPGDLRSLLPHLPTRAARLANQMLAKEPLRRPLPRDLVDRLAALEIETFADRSAAPSPSTGEA